MVLPEVGGGTMSADKLATIEERPDATGLRVSGLDQASFESFVKRYGAQFTGIYFWKCPRISDFSPIEHLPNLNYVAIYWNQRATRLWDFSRTPNIRGLQFEDFSRRRDLNDLGDAHSLEELSFGDAMFRKSVFASLEPLASLRTLKSLTFNARRIEDDRVQPLAKLTGLNHLTFPSNQFTVRQVAWLRCHCPETLQSEVLAPVRKLDRPLEDCRGKLQDVLLVGKGKPYLNSKTHAARIQRHVDEFWAIVEEFKQNPERQPEQAGPSIKPASATTSAGRKLSAQAKEVQRRQQVALAAIKKAYGTEADESGATLFVSHHLEEVEGEYWKEHLGTEKPKPERVLELVEFKSHWGDDDDEGIDTFDFTLPGGITDYVISVRFDKDGKIEEIGMES